MTAPATCDLVHITSQASPENTVSCIYLLGFTSRQLVWHVYYIRSINHLTYIILGAYMSYLNLFIFKVTYPSAELYVTNEAYL